MFSHGGGGGGGGEEEANRYTEIYPAIIILK